MQLRKISLLVLLSTYVAAQDIDDNDIPSQCRSVCASVVNLKVTCDRQNDDDDRGYINCVCAGANAATEIPACEACVANHDRNDGHDNDVNDLVRSCSFTTTTFGSMTAMATPLSTATAATPPGFTSRASSLSSAASSVRSEVSSVASSRSSQLSSVASSVSNAVQTQTPTMTGDVVGTTGNAAVGGGKPWLVGVGAAVVIGVLGLA